MFTVAIEITQPVMSRDIEVDRLGLSKVSVFKSAFIYTLHPQILLKSTFYV